MKRTRTLAEHWLWLGVTSIAAAGLYSLVPVIGRTPQLKNLPIFQQLFDVALVVHVDLSVLIWFFSMICMGAALLMEKHSARWPYWGKAGFWCTAIATLLMAFSPLDAWVPVKSNYIPVLHNTMFLTSLGLLFAGLLVTLIPLMVTYSRPRFWKAQGPIGGAWLAAALTVMLGLFGYYLGARVLPEGLELVDHYEKLFWAGGHIMQFAFTLLVMASWLLLLQALGSNLPKPKAALAIYAITILGALASLAGFAIETDSAEFNNHQTRIMIEWGGVGATLMAALIIFKLLKTKITHDIRAYGSALIVSLFLFFAGGVLGLMISGQNVTIPAHYHGMIVGITQALMGVAYVMLPRFGYASVAHTRLVFWQPIVYGVGQTMHVGGLAYCGGYGILRKTAGGFDNLAPDIKIALGIFGMGGLLAIIGGILFVIVMLRAALKGASGSHHRFLI
ncbi:MAG: cbb3-type cytochrome c oxidase subunit I [Rickettsiales bacterium]